MLSKIHDRNEGRNGKCIYEETVSLNRRMLYSVDTVRRRASRDSETRPLLVVLLCRRRTSKIKTVYQLLSVHVENPHHQILHHQKIFSSIGLQNLFKTTTVNNELSSLSLLKEMSSEPPVTGSFESDL